MRDEALTESSAEHDSTCLGKFGQKIEQWNFSKIQSIESNIRGIFISRKHFRV